MQILHFIKYTLDVDVLFYSENEMFHNFHIILDLKVHVKSFSRSLSMAIGQQIFAPLGQPPQSQRRCQRRIECPPYKISVSSWVIVFVVQKTLHYHTPFWSARLKCSVTLEFHNSIYQLLVNYKFSKVQSWGKVCYILYKGSTYKKYNRLSPTTVYGHLLFISSLSQTSLNCSYFSQSPRNSNVYSSNLGDKFQ